MNAIRPRSARAGIRRIIREESCVGFPGARSDDPGGLPSTRDRIHHPAHVAAEFTPTSERELIGVAGDKAVTVIRINIPVLRLGVMSVLHLATDLAVRRAQIFRPGVGRQKSGATA